MLVGLALLTFLNPALADMSSPDEGMLQLAESAGCSDRDMEVGLYYLSRHDEVAAVSRFRSVVTQCPTTSGAEEALAHLTEIFLKLGVASEAQTAVAVLERKFPGGRWTIDASDALRSAGLEPTENEKSWVALPFK
jgi:outer membrane protein assembly factor BamD